MPHTTFDSVVTSNNPNDKVRTFYWPLDLQIKEINDKFVILGYKIQYTVVVIDIITREKFKKISPTLSKSQPTLKKLSVVGTINFKSKKLSSLISFDCKSQKPINNTNYTIIYFKPPLSSNLEYYSLDPITIDIFWSNYKTEYNFKKEITLKFKDKLNYHFISEPAGTGGKRDYFISHLMMDNYEKGQMKNVLRLVNLTNYTRSKLAKLNDEFEYSQFDKFKFNIGNFFEMIIFIISIFYNFLIVNFFHCLTEICSFPILKFRSFSSKNLKAFEKIKDKQDTNNKDNDNDRNMNSKNRTTVLDYSIFKSYNVITLKLISYTIHQFNFRANQLCNLPSQFKKLKRSKVESEALILQGTKFSPTEYIKFYNTLWLIINDLLIGIIISNLIITNESKIEEFIIRNLTKYQNLLSETVIWLMNSPAGFKLNNNLCNFIGQLAIWVIEFWRQTIINLFIEKLPIIIKIVENLTRYGGLSIGIAFLIDILLILTINIRGFYIALTRIYYCQLKILNTLFRLFYGKKLNILKEGRIDSNFFEIDQLMIGIILFTTLIYLLPTIFIFYFTFVICQIILLFVKLNLKLTLILINHLPIVVILLTIKHKERLPSSITIEYEYEYKEDNEKDNDSDQLLFKLSTKCLTMREIWDSHMNSLLNFNLFNLNNSYVEIMQRECLNTDEIVKDILENWKSINIGTLIKRIVFGQPIRDYDYKRMF